MILDLDLVFEFQRRVRTSLKYCQAASAGSPQPQILKLSDIRNDTRRQFDPEIPSLWVVDRKWNKLPLLFLAHLPNPQQASQSKRFKHRGRTTGSSIANFDILAQKEAPKASQCAIALASGQIVWCLRSSSISRSS